MTSDTPEQDLTPTDDSSSTGSAAMRERLAKIVEPVLAAHRCELIELDWRREPVGWVLRLYVEHLGHDPRLTIGGVGIDECARISRDVSMALDVAETPDHAFHLEVSSPGLERPLTKLEHWRRFQGLRAKVRLHSPLAAHPSRKGFHGTIEETPAGDDAAVRFRDDQVGVLSFPLDTIARAHLVYEPPPKVKPGKGPKRVTQASAGSQRATPRERENKHRKSTPEAPAGAEGAHAHDEKTQPRASRGASENDR